MERTYQPPLVDLHDSIDEDADVESFQVGGYEEVGWEKGECLQAFS